MQSIPDKQTTNKNKAAATCVAHTAGSYTVNTSDVNRLIVAWRSEAIANHSSYD